MGACSLPPTILSLYKPHNKNLETKALHKECKKTFDTELVVTPDESHFLFKSTLLQSRTSIWFDHLKARLTASKFGPICHTSIEKPAKSLVNILYRQNSSMTAAMKWGCDNETIAIEAYTKEESVKHDSFEIDSAGLFVNPNAPHLGASADSFVSCKCCGLGVVEIKCPFSVRQTVPTNAPYIEKSDGEWRLSRKHNYYYQIQGQMVITERSYCDFVSWNTNGLYIERISFDDEFVSNMMNKLDLFFVKVILPKVLCGIDEPVFDSNIFCVCRRGEAGKMIACDSPQCEIEWFHYACLRLPTDFEPIVVMSSM